MKNRSLRLIGLFVTGFLLMPPLVSRARLTTGFVPQKSNFALKYKNQISSYHVTPLFALPGETVFFEIEQPTSTDQFQFAPIKGGAVSDGFARWIWTAPETPGLYPIKITEALSAESMVVNAFVMVPYERMQKGVLNGYKIGGYPVPPTDKAQMYGVPAGFVEVTPETRDVYVSPHFRLSQFLCKQKGGYPKYVVLREPLLFKLEGVLENLNADGITCKSLTVMSGYRTPYYNKILRNVRFSRHMFGDAADIFVDENPKDGMMDDINEDGKVDRKDAEYLFDFISRISEKPSLKELVGGLGRYKPTKHHGPFVHVDARGSKAKWKN